MSMQVTVTLDNSHYAVKLGKPIGIAIPIRFDGEQLSVFGAPPARREPYVTGGFTGDVSKGGSCNCDIYSFAPHTSGTHTECVGHIMEKPVKIHDVLQDALIPITLVTITPEEASHETYTPARQPGDMLITRAALEKALDAANPAFLAGLVIRTVPNGAVKRRQHYSGAMPPYFSTEAMQYLNELGVRHLLADIPSIDRLEDGGKLVNHRIFWDVPPGKKPDEKKLSPKTVTELIYVADAIADGLYMLNLQIAPLMADAAPSRPVLYEIDRL